MEIRNEKEWNRVNCSYPHTHKYTPWTLVRKLTTPIGRPPLVDEVSANVCRYGGIAWSALRIPHGRQSQISRTKLLLFNQVAPHLSSRYWMDPIPDPLLLRKSGNAWNRTRDLWICSQEVWPLHHRGRSLVLHTCVPYFLTSTEDRICDITWIFIKGNLSCIRFEVSRGWLWRMSSSGI
jgi:hypothetical protein